MGGTQSSCQKIANIVRSNDPVLNIRVTGPEGSGKKSIISYIKHGKATSLEEESEESNKNWILYDKYKLMLWTEELDISKVVEYEHDDNEDAESHSNAIIYVIDGTDEDNFIKVRDEIRRELERSRLSPELLIFVNKCDDPTCAGIDELYNTLEVSKITDRHVNIKHTSALTGEGVKEGLDWLCHRFEIKNGQYINRKGALIRNKS